MQRAKENRNPFLYTVLEEVAPVIDQLRSVERESWPRFCRLAPAHAERTATAAARRASPTTAVTWRGIWRQALIVEWLKARWQDNCVRSVGRATAPRLAHILLLPQPIEVLLRLIAADLVLERIDPLLPLKFVDLLSLPDWITFPLDSL